MKKWKELKKWKEDQMIRKTTTDEVIYNSLEFKKSRVRHGKKQLNCHEVDRRKVSVTGS